MLICLKSGKDYPIWSISIDLVIFLKIMIQKVYELTLKQQNSYKLYFLYVTCIIYGHSGNHIRNKVFTQKKVINHQTILMDQIE